MKVNKNAAIPTYAPPPSTGLKDILVFVPKDQNIKSMKCSPDTASQHLIKKGLTRSRSV